MKAWMILPLLLTQVPLALSDNEECPKHREDERRISGDSGSNSTCQWTVTADSNHFYVEINVLNLRGTGESGEARNIWVDVTAENQGNRFTRKLNKSDCIVLQSFGGGAGCNGQQPTPRCAKDAVDPRPVDISVGTRVKVDMTVHVVACDDKGSTDASKRISSTPTTAVSPTDRSVDHLTIALPLLGILILFAVILVAVALHRRKQRERIGEQRTPISMSQISEEGTYAEIQDDVQAREEVVNTIYQEESEEKMEVANPLHTERDDGKEIPPTTEVQDGSNQENEYVCPI